jgi:PAS domain S-box-containing protein
MNAEVDKYKFMFDHSVVGKSITLPSGEIEINQAFCDMVGYSREELKGKKWQDVTFPDDIELNHHALESLIIGKKNAVQVYKRYLHKNGSIVWADVSVSLRRDDSGQPLYFMTEINNITERMIAQQALYASEQKMRTIFNTMTEGIALNEIIYDQHGEMIDYRILEVNDAFFKVADYKGKVVGNLATELYGMTHEYIKSFWLTHRATNQVAHTEMISPLGNRTYFISTSPFVNDKFITSFVDITEQKKAEAAMIDAVEKVRAANLAKSQFLANMSHEIRTPMNGMLGMLQLLEMTPLSDEQKEFIHISRTSADSLLALINDILDYSKIEAGKLSLEKIPFSLNEIVNDIMDLFHPAILKKGLALEFHKEPAVPDLLIGDPYRLKQVLSNLIGNSVKFTQKGRIDVYIKSIGNRDNHMTELEFTVVDTGVGIPEDKIDVLFKSFSQVDGSDTRKYGGSGLGLAISKNLAELMDGDIRVESKPGEGSSFHFTCILKRVVTEKAVIVPVMEKLSIPQTEQDINLLLADDDEVSCLFVTLLASRKGWKVTVAKNGKEAIDLFRTLPFDAVLMDVQMPGINGFEVTGVIRMMESKTHQNTPIVAVTAKALKGDREKCLDAGMDDYLSKPLIADQFYETVEKWCLRPRQ